MSSAGGQLGRIWRASAPATRAAAAVQPAAAKRWRPPPQIAIDKLFYEPSLDVFVSNFKRESASTYFRKRHIIYIYAVKRLSRHGRFSAIEDIIEHHKRYGQFADEREAIRFIHYYGRAPMFQHAQNLFDELPALKCRRTSMSFNTLLSAALHSKEFAKVLEIFNEIPSELGIDPNLMSYNTLIKALGELAMADEAMSKLGEMMKKGIHPNVVTFNSLAFGVYKNKGFSEGEKLWNMMLERFNGVVPDVRSYNVKLKAMIDAGMVEEAVDLFEEMKMKDLNPVAVTYNLVIKGFCDKGDVEEAKRWYWKLSENRVLWPNWFTFGTLVEALGEDGDGDLKFDLSMKVIGRQFLVDEAALQRVVDGLVREERIGLAEELVGFARTNYYHQYNLVMP